MPLEPAQFDDFHPSGAARDGCGASCVCACSLALADPSVFIYPEFNPRLCPVSLEQYVR